MECIGLLVLAIMTFWMWGSEASTAPPTLASPRPPAPPRPTRPKLAQRARKSILSARPPDTSKAITPAVQLKRCPYHGCETKIGLRRQHCRKHARERQHFMERHCGEKVQHPTRASAETHKKELARKTRATYEVYKCEVCNLFHVGHGKASGRRGRRR